MKCLLLICHRLEELHLSTDRTKLVPTSLTERLVQEVHSEEKAWLEDKYAELEERGQSECNPKFLLSFMVLRTGFNKNKILNIVKNLVKDLLEETYEFELLQFIALITEKTPTSKRLTKIALPLECCDELYSSYKTMDESTWERVLSKTIDILIVFEGKDQGSGYQIRMSHPTLANAVLKCLLEKNNQSLSQLTISMLKSKLLRNASRGREELAGIVHVMLNRRFKEEYDDEKQTRFSPLIETILEENKGCQNACNVLKVGFSLFLDDTKMERYAGKIAQTLARLFCKHGEISTKYKDAIEWAKTSIDLAPKDSKCYFLHTYGSVLKDKFQYERDKKVSKLKKDDQRIQPEDAVPLLEIIFNALDQFINAQSEFDIKQNPTHVNFDLLCSFKDTVVSINMITRFLNTKVKFPSDFDLRCYLVDDNYIPETLPDSWEIFHERVKNFQFYGLKAFEVLERHLCFFSVFNENDRQGHSVPKKFSDLQTEYAKLLADFCDVIGESSDQIPPSLKGPGLAYARNNFHRRRILCLKGNSYMNILGLYGNYKRSKEGFSRKKTEETFLKIRKHLSNITEKRPSDFLVAVCINIALGLIGGERDPVHVIIDNCESIVRLTKNSTLLDLAYFFITVLMWPSVNNKTEYNDELFKKALKHLKGISKKVIKQPSQRRDLAFYREEYKRCKPTAQFFLANESTFNHICHRFDLFCNESSIEDDSIWKKKSTNNLLRRVHGHVMTRGESFSQCIILDNEKYGGDTIEISQIRGKTSEFLSEEPVSFYLGFSMSGPIAYNIQPIKSESTLQ